MVVTNEQSFSHCVSIFYLYVSFFKQEMSDYQTLRISEWAADVEVTYQANYQRPVSNFLQKADVKWSANWCNPRPAVLVTVIWTAAGLCNCNFCWPAAAMLRVARPGVTRHRGKTKTADFRWPPDTAQPTPDVSSIHVLQAKYNTSIKWKCWFLEWILNYLCENLPYRICVRKHNNFCKSKRSW